MLYNNNNNIYTDWNLPLYNGSWYIPFLIYSFPFINIGQMHQPNSFILPVKLSQYTWQMTKDVEL